jgi:hypothetical protein
MKINKLFKMAVLGTFVSMSVAAAAQLSPSVVKKVEGSLTPGSKVVNQSELGGLGLHELQILVPGAVYKKEVVYTNNAGTFLTQNVYNTSEQKQMIPDFGYKDLPYKDVSMVTIGNGPEKEYLIIDPIYIEKSKFNDLVKKEKGKTKYVYIKTNMGDESSVLMNFELYDGDKSLVKNVLKKIEKLDELKSGKITKEAFSKYIYNSIENKKKISSKETIMEIQTRMRAVNEIVEILLNGGKTESGFAKINNEFKIIKNRLSQKIDDSKGEVKDIKDSILFSIGNGPKQVYLFTDPDCPYCVKLDKAISGLGVKGDFTINVIPFPLQSLHENALDKSRYVYTLESKERKEEFSRIGGNKASVSKIREILMTKTEKEIKEIDRKIGQGMAIGRIIGVQGTPSLFKLDENGKSIKVNPGEVLKLKKK